MPPLLNLCGFEGDPVRSADTPAWQDVAGRVAFPVQPILPPRARVEASDLDKRLLEEADARCAVREHC